MADKDSGLNFTIGLLLGAAAGVALGFLYAPKPGWQTRQMLKEKAEEARDRAEEAAEKAKEAAAEAGKRVEGRLHTSRKEGKEAAE